MSTPRKFGKVPTDILRRPDLTHATRSVMVAVAALGHRSGLCYASNATIADRAGCCPRSVRYVLTRLVRLKLVEVEQDPTRKTRRTIRPTWQGWGEKAEKPTERPAAPYVAKVAAPLRGNPCRAPYVAKVATNQNRYREPEKNLGDIRAQTTTTRTRRPDSRPIPPPIELSPRGLAHLERIREADRAEREADPPPSEAEAAIPPAVAVHLAPAEAAALEAMDDARRAKIVHDLVVAVEMGRGGPPDKIGWGNAIRLLQATPPPPDIPDDASLDEMLHALANPRGSPGLVPRSADAMLRIAGDGPQSWNAWLGVATDLQAGKLDPAAVSGAFARACRARDRIPPEKFPAYCWSAVRNIRSA